MQIDNSLNLISQITNQISKTSFQYQVQLCQQHYNFKKEYLCLEKSCQSYQNQNITLFCSECLKYHYLKSHQYINNTQQNNIHVILGKIKTKAALTINQFRSLYIQNIQNISKHCSFKINTNNISNKNNQLRGVNYKDLPLGEINITLYNLINQIVQNFKKGYQQKHLKNQSELKLLFENNQKNLQQMIQNGKLSTLQAKIKFEQILELSLLQFREKLNTYCNQIRNQSNLEFSKELYEQINLSLKNLFMVQNQNKKDSQISQNQLKPYQATPKLNKYQYSPPLPSKIGAQYQKRSTNNFKFEQVLSYKLQSSIQQNIQKSNDSNFEYENQCENLRKIIKTNIQSLAQKDLQINQLSKALNKEREISKKLSSRLKDFKKLDQKFMKIEDFNKQFQKEEEQFKNILQKSKSETFISSPIKYSKNINQFQDPEKKGTVNQIAGNIMVQKNSFIRKSKQTAKNTSNNSIKSIQQFQKKEIGSKSVAQQLSFNSIYDAPQNRNLPARMYIRKTQK